MSKTCADAKGMALILALFVILVLAVLSSSFLYKQVNMSFSTSRYTEATRALWVAEAGLHQARKSLPTAPSPATLAGGNYTVTVTNINGASEYFQVVSKGSVGTISRTVEAVLSTREVDASKFKYGIESTVDINFKGSSTVWGETTIPNPPDKKTRDSAYYKENSTLNFADLFTFSTAELKAMSTQYSTFPSGTISGLNWVTAASSHFNGSMVGSGILIVEGNLRVTGTIDFTGIIYVIGTLDMAGTCYVKGSILAESAATVDTDVTGTADIEHSTEEITEALEILKYRAPQIVSWKEIVS